MQLQPMVGTRMRCSCFLVQVKGENSVMNDDGLRFCVIWSTFCHKHLLYIDRKLELVELPILTKLPW